MSAHILLFYLFSILINTNPDYYFPPSDSIKASSLSTNDHDNDGVYDIYDLDDDNDGIPDIVEKTNCGGASIIFYEDFGSGTYPGAALPAGTTSLSYFAPTQPANYPNSVDDGQYVIAGTASEGKSDWQDVHDHTSGDGTGYMLLVNAAYNPDEFYRTTVAVSPSTLYDFKAWTVVVNSMAISFIARV